MKKSAFTLIFILFGLAINVTYAGDEIANLRGNKPITVESEAPPIFKADEVYVWKKRDYPMQPPLIPHKIEKYQVDKNANKCLSCHSRKRTEESQAPMISVTHYMDRETNFLADLSPRRYFCNQCHVSQSDTKPLVKNKFMDVDQLLKQGN